VNGHETTIVKGWGNEESFGIRVCMSVNVGTNITCPVTMVADVVKVLLVHQVVLHVAEHSGRTRSHTTSSETFGVEFNVRMNGCELHDGGEVSRYNGGEESTISTRGEIGDVMPKFEDNIKGLTVGTGVPMGTTV